jgi:hypothetical protein
LGRPLGLAQDARKTAHHRVHLPSVPPVVGNREGPEGPSFWGGLNNSNGAGVGLIPAGVDGRASFW